jgi:hypothetical protein
MQNHKQQQGNNSEALSHLHSNQQVTLLPLLKNKTKKVKRKEKGPSNL